MVNFTIADIEVFVPSIIGGALGALNDFIALIVLLSIVGGIAVSIGALMRAFKSMGK